MEKQNKYFVPSGATKVLIMVDKTKMYEPCGRWCSPYCEKENIFLSFVDMIMQIDNFYTSCGLLQQSMQFRSFEEQSRTSLKILEVTKYMEENIFEQAKAERATFVVQVLFRQNATWQGKVKWVEGGKEQKFRSTLELLRMMDEAIIAGEEPLQKEQSI